MLMAMAMTFYIMAKQNAVFPSEKEKHKADIRLQRFDKSALTKHVFDHEHSMNWTNVKISDFELDFTKRRFIESYLINQISQQYE